MENETFELLLIISKDIIYKLNEQAGDNPHDRAVKTEIIYNRLKLLASYGFIKSIGDSKWAITEYGQEVSRRNSWSDYLNHIKEYNDRASKKEKYDLRISWLQANTGWLPYLFSIIGIVISFYALSVSKNQNNLQETNTEPQKNMKTQQEYINSEVEDIQNEKAVDKDTFHLKS